MEWSNLIDQGTLTNIWTAKCLACRQVQIWTSSQFGFSTHNNMVYPSSVVAPLAHAEMPEHIRSDFNEARQIAQASPRGAAALLRLCVQKLCVHLGKPGKNINDDIAALVRDGLDPEMQRAMDVVRIVGNSSVHPGELSEEDVAGFSDSLFEFVNMIVEDRIAKPKKIAELFGKMPPSTLDGIVKRDSKKP